MNNLRFELPPQAWAAAGTGPLGGLSPNDAAGLKQLAADVVRLAAQDTAGAADVLRDMFALTPPRAGSEFATAVATRFEPTGLAALNQDAAGREIVALLERFGGAEVAGLLQGIRDPGATQLTRTADWSWAGATASSVRPAQARAGSSATGGSNNADAERVKSAFKQEFAAKAANKEEFDAFMQQVYGDKYDKQLAEQYRQMALRGDFSFLPDVKFVDAATLQGGKGAYNEAEGVVYISRDIAEKDPALAAQVFVEEAGAHLDSKLNTVDTQGDEGEMFRRVLSGEQLSQHEIDAIRNDDDHGTIVVDGKQVQVEFWFGDDIVDAASDAVDAVGDAASSVVDAAGDAVDEIGSGIKDYAEGVVDACAMVVQGVFVDAIGGYCMNMLEGRFADAFDSVVHGLDKAIFRAGRRAFNGALSGIGHLLKVTSHVFPSKFGGNLMREAVDRVVDSARSVANAAIEVYRNCVRMPFSIIGGFAQDMGGALKAWARGDIGDGFKRLGMGFVHPFVEVGGTVVDNVVIIAQAGVNVVGNLSGQYAPSRELSDDEKAYLKSVYGDSIDLDDVRIHRGNISLDLGVAPHTLGNDIYIPDESKYWNPDGTLTAEGKILLVHESFHVYQSQHEGNRYIHDALLAQVDGIVTKGDRNAGYDFTDALKSGKPFREWNAEQQAEFIEAMTRARDGKLNTSYDLDGDGDNDTRYDANGDGRIDPAELAAAWFDANGDSSVDKGKSRVSLSQDDVQRAMAIWDALKSDRPDRNLV